MDAREVNVLRFINPCIHSIIHPGLEGVTHHIIHPLAEVMLDILHITLDVQVSFPEEVTKGVEMVINCQQISSQKSVRLQEAECYIMEILLAVMLRGVDTVVNFRQVLRKMESRLQIVEQHIIH